MQQQKKTVIIVVNRTQYHHTQVVCAPAGSALRLREPAQLPGSEDWYAEPPPPIPLPPPPPEKDDIPRRRKKTDVLVKAEAAAGREQSPNARHLEQWLQSQKPSAVAGVQMEMLRELPLEAWDAGIARCEQLVLAAAQDKEELQNELLPASRLYEMLHDSYDEAVPHLAIKLLRYVWLVLY